MSVNERNYLAPQSLRDFMQAWPLHEWQDESDLRWAYRDNGRAAPSIALLPGALGNGDVAWKLAQALGSDLSTTRTAWLGAPWGWYLRRYTVSPTSR